MDDRKAYGLMAALGRAIGDAARAGDPAPLNALRAADSREAFLSFLATVPSKAPRDLLDAFAASVTDADWRQWRSKLVLQAKMTAEGGKPAPGHERAGGVKGA